MKVGDLVKHKSSGSYGTVVELRSNHWQTDVGMAKIYWHDGAAILHSTGQLEVINEKQV